MQHLKQAETSGTRSVSEYVPDNDRIDLARSIESATGDGPNAIESLIEAGILDPSLSPTDQQIRTLQTPAWTGVFDVYVEEGLTSSIQPALDEYASDLELEGYTVTIQEFSGSARELRDILRDRWANDDLEGALFVGDLPHVEFTSEDNFGVARNSTYVHDFYFMDLDGEYIFNSSGPDAHTGTVDPEIYVSRLLPSNVTELIGDSEVKLINGYFEKLHQVRTGEISFKDRGAVFVDDDWSPFRDQAKSLDVLYENVNLINHPNESTRDAYIELLSWDCESLFESIHSWSAAHVVSGTGGGVISSADIANIDLKFGFLNMFNCSSADYTQYSNLIGAYLYSAGKVLNAVGSTKTGSMLDFANFYDPQAGGASMGQAFLEWFDLNAAPTDDPSADWKVDWFYGMTMQGDPTLRPTAIGQVDPLLRLGPYEFCGGVADAQVVPHQASYMLADGTLTFTFTADAVHGRRTLFSKDSHGFDDGGHLGVFLQNGAIVVRLQSESDSFTASSSCLIVPATLHHVAVTFGAAGLTVYVDGKAEAFDAYTGGLLGNQEPIVLGANQWASGDLVADNLRDPFDGRMSDFALYGTALDADQVAQLSDAALGGCDNTAPVAQDDAITTDEDSPLSGDVLADNGLGIDSDADGDSLMVTEVNGSAAAIGDRVVLGSGALLTLNANGIFDYDPNGRFEDLVGGESATDSFTYTINDGNGGTDTATVTVTITGGVYDYVAVDDAGPGFITDEDTAFVTDAVDPNDFYYGEPIVLRLDTTDTLGVATLMGWTNRIEYDPNGQFESLRAGETATDTFKYTAIGDPGDDEGTATVTITVHGVNDAPVADDAAFQVCETAAVNDVVGVVPARDAEDDPLGFLIVAGDDDDIFDIDATGQILVADPGKLDAATTPSYQLTVEVSDGQASDTATVDISVLEGGAPVPILDLGPYEFCGSVADAQIVPHHASYLLPDGTLTFTFTADAVHGRRTLFSKDSRGFDDGGHLGVFVQNGAIAVRMQSESDSFLVTSEPLITVDTPHTVAVTFGTPQGLTLYVDGEKVGSNGYTGGIENSEEPIVLGANQWASGDGVADFLSDPFDGNVTEFALYDIAFNDTQVQSMALQAAGVDNLLT